MISLRAIIKIQDLMKCKSGSSKELEVKKSWETAENTRTLFPLICLAVRKTLAAHHLNHNDSTIYNQ